MIILYTLCFLWYSCAATILYAQKAIIIEPVADLFGAPQVTAEPIPYAQKCANGTMCPRPHQLLYHDIVEVEHTGSQYTCIRVPHVWYTQGEKPTRYNRFWIQNQHLCLENSLSTPAWQKITPSENSPYICLIKPWYCSALATTFSVGTRFCSTTPSLHKAHYCVYFYNPRTQNVDTMRIPVTHAYQPSTHRLTEQLMFYQKLILQWSRSTACIPYVWGGCSIQTTCAPAYHAIEKQQNATYHRLGEPVQKTGIDCAGLIMLTARTAGLPYYLKNSSAIAYYGVKISAAQLEIGDILWTPGHVMIVVDPTNGMLLEASHYTHGTGCMRTAHISDLFNNVHSFAEFEQILNAQHQLKRKNRNGKVYQTITRAKLISMRATAINASNEQ